MELLLDSLLTIVGVYLIYSAVKMKRTGEVPQGIIVRKDADLSKAPDIPGFISYTYGKIVIIGVCACICGGISIVNDMYGGLTMVQLILAFAFFILLIIFGVFMAKAQKKYLGF